MEEKKTEVDFEALAKKMSEDFQSKVSQQFDDVKSKVSGLDAKFESLTKKDDEEDEEQDEEIVLTRKEIKKLLEEERGETEKKLRGIVNESLNELTTKGQWDARTEKDFPMLSKSSPVYSEDFYKDVQKEVEGRIKSGSDRNSPRLIHDSAAFVFATNAKYQKLSQSNLENQIREMNNRDAQFSFNSRKRNQAPAPSSEVLSMASKLGLSHDRVKEYYKKLAN